ncbi:MAG: hypothetical protein QY307_10385 [Acidimicrobiia bacterium]|nr:MAG: hypothetical protein QY307_10385 [Acidimicrobiia bacterium]
MHRAVSLAAVVLALAACSTPSAPIPTTAPPGTPSTVTTIEDDTCGLLATDTARYLESVMAVLDQTTLDEARDRESWPEGMVALEQMGKDLDLRSQAMRCDRARVQTQAFEEARLDPQSELAQYLLHLLGQE